jgi:hypothetical protein
VPPLQGSCCPQSIAAFQKPFAEIVDYYLKKRKFDRGGDPDALSHSDNPNNESHWAEEGNALVGKGRPGRNKQLVRSACCAHDKRLQHHCIEKNHPLSTQLLNHERHWLSFHGSDGKTKTQRVSLESFTQRFQAKPTSSNSVAHATPAHCTVKWLRRFMHQQGFCFGAAASDGDLLKLLGLEHRSVDVGPKADATQLKQLLSKCTMLLDADFTVRLPGHPTKKDKGNDRNNFWHNHTSGPKQHLVFCRRCRGERKSAF